jgi:hypothetical protein
VRQKRTAKRLRLILLFAACSIGYAIAASHVTALRSVGHSSPAETVALRFPSQWSGAPPAVTLASMRSAAADAELFSPLPMGPASQPQPQSHSAAEQQAIENAAPEASDPRIVQTASLANVDLAATAAGEAPARHALRAAAKAPASPPRPPAASRAGYILDDAQIASIKERLHLTPDQERMWPAVEAALRNMAYKRSQQAAATRSASRSLQAAAVDPEAVQGLKSAAVPLIMSFSSEQKDEVRSLAHVMGLDQLATQF